MAVRIARKTSMLLPLPVGSDEISFPDTPLGEDGPDSGGVVFGVNPVADVLAVSVELRADAAQNVGDLPRNELLDMLVGSVVVRAVGYGGFHAIGAMPGADEHVGGRLGGAVGARWAIGRFLRESIRVVQGQIAIDFVGRDVVKAHAVVPSRLEKREGALDVSAKEGGGIGDGIVVVALGGEMDAGVGFRKEAID